MQFAENIIISENMPSLSPSSDLIDWVTYFDKFIKDQVTVANIRIYKDYVTEFISISFGKSSQGYITYNGNTLCNRNKCGLCGNFTRFFANAFNQISDYISKCDKIKISMLEEFKLIFSRCFWDEFSVHNTCESEFSILIPVDSIKTDLDSDIFILVNFKTTCNIDKYYNDYLTYNVQEICFCTLFDLSTDWPMCDEDGFCIYEESDDDNNDTTLN